MTTYIHEAITLCQNTHVQKEREEMNVRVIICICCRPYNMKCQLSTSKTRVLEYNVQLDYFNESAG